MLAEGEWGRRHPTSSATLWIKLLVSVNKEKFKPLPPISFPKKNLVETNVSKVLIILWVSHSFFIKFALQTDTLWSNRSSYINWCKISFWKWACINPLQYCKVFRTLRDYGYCIVVYTAFGKCDICVLETIIHTKYIGAIWDVWYAFR